MCVRCGTGSIAWCTSPDRHASETPDFQIRRVLWTQLRERVQTMATIAEAQGNRERQDALREVLRTMENLESDSR